MSPIPLVCFPFAGAGASFFKPWKSLVSDHLEVLAIQLPGREQFFMDPPYRDVEEAMIDILPVVLDHVSETGKIALFGHSMGAVLAYELACRLLKTTTVQLVRLVVSGSPSAWEQRTERATGLDDTTFLERVREFAGYDHPALNHPDMRKLLLPTLRADVEMHENYRPSSYQPLPIPITALRGSDDELVSAEAVAQWQQVTTIPLHYVEIEGGHMYLSDVPEQLLNLIETVVVAE